MNVGNVVAALLVKVTPLVRQVNSFSAGNILQVNDGVRDAALRSEDQALQVSGLFGVGIANLRIFGDGKVKGARSCSGPFHSA